MANFVRNILAILLTLFFIGINVREISARRHSPLLIEDDGSRRNRPAECQFGKQLKELGSTWFPDLGAPFGRMYCIKCECIPVQKKRRIVARVQCRNIKNECPKPTCEEPILLPGRCCKSCPGDSHSPDVVQDIPQQITNEEEERNMKHFGALLTGRTSFMLKRDDMLSTYATNNPQNFAATGRFSFHKKNLYYSFYISEKAIRPRAIQFIDNEGRILEEHSLVIPSNGPYSIYQNSTGKVCGVWRRVPRDYRRLLREDQMNVVLLWGGKQQTELALAGPISKYPALSTELFSALLEPGAGTNPDQMAGAGGTAIVSTSSGVTSSIHLTIVLNGLFSPDEMADVPLNIRLESVEKKQVILEDIQRVKKPNHDINIIEVSSPVSVYDLRLLTRGKLQIVVESRKRPEALRIVGNVVTRVSCELFQTLLATHNPESKTKSNGLAWLYLNKDGSLVYNIQTHNLNIGENPLITLIDDSAKRKTELEDLTSSLQMDHAQGTVDRLGPRVLEPLYNGDLAINIATESETSLIRGKFVVRPVADSRDSQEPLLLKRANDQSPAHSVGMAWVAVDNECNLHYEVTVTGISSHFHPLALYLEDIPLEAYGAPVSRRLLEEFNGNHLEGFVLSIPSTDLAKLESSVCFLEVMSKDKNEKLLRSKLKPIKVPNHCYPIYSDNDVGFATASDNSDNNLHNAETKCYHSERFYDDGEQWYSSQESCTLCSCGNGRVKCDAIKCPPLKCKKDEQLQRKGDCCPTCTGKHTETNNNTLPRGCKLGETFHKAGSSWHPYLPPNGFDTCAVCTCDASTLEVSCPRTQCPPLNCKESVAYRPDKKACCKKCPEVKVHSKVVNQDEMKDQGSKQGTLSSPQIIMATGGCKSPMGYHSNGQDWHPIIASHGEQKCIKCKCKDGNISCDRKRCSRGACSTQKPGTNNKKQQQTQLQSSDNSTDECCQCRARRHQQGHRRKQKQQQEQLQQQQKQQNSSKS